MTSASPYSDLSIQKAREATDALIEASRVVLTDLRHNQRDLEALLAERYPPNGANRGPAG
jgi:hypothetical protein